jgi:cytohesin
MDATRSLHHAAEQGDLAAVEALLRSDPYLVASREDYKLTSLHRAAMAGHAAVAKALLARSAEVDAKDYAGGTPLHAAAAQGHSEAAAVLLDAGANPNARDQEGHTPLHRAAEGGHAAVTALLLERGADPNVTGQFTGAPLHAAAERGFQGVVETLLDHGASANIRSRGSHTPFTPWHAAKRAGHGAIAAVLKDHGGNDRAAGPILIHSAAEHGYLGRLKVLLKQDPALINTRDVVYRRTPLHWAANNNHPEAAELLLAHGADPSLRDKAGHTPADRARAMGHAVLAERLEAD